MILFHGTSATFETFERAALGAGDSHPNGHLGVWLTTSPQLASAFGDWTLAVDAPGDVLYDMPIGDLSRLAHRCQREDDGGIELHRATAEALRKQGFEMIAIRETDGTAPTMVSLYPERCRIVDRILGKSDALGMTRYDAMAMQSFADRGLEISERELSLRG